MYIIILYIYEFIYDDYILNILYMQIHLLYFMYLSYYLYRIIIVRIIKIY